MIKTLIVSYAPGAERSYTARLVEALTELAQTKYTQIEHVDLLTHLPNLITPEIYDIYYRRNYGNERLTAEEQRPMAQMDQLALQFKNADVVALVFPVYAFSMPAAVKAYLESVTQKGVTFEITSNGFKGLMNSKKLLVVTTSGGDMLSAVAVNGKLANEQARHLSTFMNFAEFKAVNVDELYSSAERNDHLINQAVAEIGEIVEEWYRV